MQLFRWLYVVIHHKSNNTEEQGYILKAADGYYENKERCIEAARKWLQSAAYDIAWLDHGPLLVIERV